MVALSCGHLTASIRIKREFGAFWIPSHDVDQLTASELSTKMDQFKLKLKAAITEMKFNLAENSCPEKREFYQKWLLNRRPEEKESLIRPASKSKLSAARRRESTVSSRRESSVGFMARKTVLRRSAGPSEQNLPDKKRTDSTRSEAPERIPSQSINIFFHQISTLHQFVAKLSIMAKTHLNVQKRLFTLFGRKKLS